MFNKEKESHNLINVTLIRLGKPYSCLLFPTQHKNSEFKGIELKMSSCLDILRTIWIQENNS